MARGLVSPTATRCMLLAAFRKLAVRTTTPARILSSSSSRTARSNTFLPARAMSSIPLPQDFVSAAPLVFLSALQLTTAIELWSLHQPPARGPRSLQACRKWISAVQRSISVNSKNPSLLQQAETWRQFSGLELIASENLTSLAVMEANGSIMTKSGSLCL